jgi:hypothetical protein
MSLWSCIQKTEKVVLSLGQLSVISSGGPFKSLENSQGTVQSLTGRHILASQKAHLRYLILFITSICQLDIADSAEH